MKVYGNDYPVSGMRKLASTGLSMLQYGGMGLLLFGDRIFGYLGTNYPAWYSEINYLIGI